MADNIDVSPGTGRTIRTDLIAGVDWVCDKLAWGADGTATLVDSGVSALPIQDGGNSITVDGSLTTVSTVTAVTTVGTITNVVHIDDNSSTISIDDGAGSITVDGTVAFSNTTIAVTNAGTFAVQAVCTNAGTFAVQAAQSGTWNITNVSGTVSLPTGASTAAKQPALGTAGTASSDVITVQGIASMTALKVDGSAVTQPVSIASAVPITDNSGSLTVDNGGTFAVQAAQSGTWTVGLSAAQTLATVTTLGTITNVVHVDDNSSSLTVDGTVAATQSGTWTVGLSAAQTLATVTTVGTVSTITNVVHIDDNSGSLTVDGTVTANLAPTTSGGLSFSSGRVISGASTNATSVKASAGQLYALYVSNINASPRYLKLYNKASSPTVGSDTPVLTFLIPGNTSGAAGCFEFSNGIAFGTGIALAITTGVADADTGAVAANELVVNVLYK